MVLTSARTMFDLCLRQFGAPFVDTFVAYGQYLPDCLHPVADDTLAVGQLVFVKVPVIDTDHVNQKMTVGSFFLKI